MTSLDDKTVSANENSMQSVQTLVIGRLIAIFLLFAATWIWYRGHIELSVQSINDGPFLVFIVGIGFTSIYFLFLRISKKMLWQLWLQFSLDVLMITWLVWRTGDVTSAYITLYIVLISVSSFYFKPTSVIAISLVSVGLFALVVALASTGVIASNAIEQPVSKIVQITSFHVVAFLVVGLLAAKLSERRSSGEKLIEATRSLASLRGTARKDNRIDTLRADHDRSRGRHLHIQSRRCRDNGNAFGRNARPFDQDAHRKHRRADRAQRWTKNGSAISRRDLRPVSQHRTVSPCVSVTMSLRFLRRITRRRGSSLLFKI